MKRLLPGAKAARFVPVSAQAVSFRSAALRGFLLVAGLSAVSACSSGPIVTGSSWKSPTMWPKPSSGPMVP